MIYPGILRHLSPFKKLLLMVLLALFSISVFMLAGWLFALLIFNDFFILVNNLGTYDDGRVINLLKYLQIVSQIGLFIMPPIIFAYLDGGNILAYLRLNVLPGTQIIILGFIMIFAALPMVHWWAGINEMMRFPEWLRGLELWMKQSEKGAEEVTRAFLNVGTIGGLMINLLMIAILPALGEELLFRGILQKLLHQWFRNVHWAVLVSAVIFSALHLQFYGFLPRTILGIMFGYLFVITKSLWVPILVHFLNNGAAVLAAFLYRKDFLESDFNEIGQLSNPVWVLGSLLMVLMLFTVIYRLSDTRDDILP
jgi:uncharacterized protein